MPDGATLVLGDEAGTIEKFKLAGTSVASVGPALALHGGGIAALAISPSGAKIAAITETGAVRFADAAADAAPDPGIGHLGPVERLAFSGDFLISGASDATIWTWELAGSRRQAKIELAGDLMAMTPAPDDQGIYAQVDVYARPAAEGYASLSRHLIEGYTLSGARKFSEELEHGTDSLKYCGYRKQIQAVTGSRWKEIDPTTFDVSERARSTGRSGRIGPNGGFAAFEGHGALIVLDDVGTHRLGTAGCSPVNGVAFDPAGDVIAMTDGTNAIRMWSTDGTLLGDVGVTGASAARDGVVLPDQSTALFATWNGILVWDQARSAAGIIELDTPTALAITPDGERLAVGFETGRIGIFDLATLRATMKPLETFAAPALTDDDCHRLRPEHFPSADPPLTRRFGSPKPEVKVEP
jgi:WD40 repeat protein